MTTRNTFALQAVRDLIKTHPEKHGQGDWAAVPGDAFTVKGKKAYATCGTTACVAGWAASLAGAQYVMDLGDDGIEAGRTYFIDYVKPPTGPVQFIAHYAEKVLGITENEANYLFDGDLDRKTVLRLLKRLIKGEAILDEDGEWLPA